MEPPTKRRRLGPSPCERNTHDSELFGHPEDDDELAYEPEEASAMRQPGYRLAKSRASAASRLKLTFEHIFEKYERDFTGIGDEIDLRTGNIVVNNGHLRSMQHERDTGEDKSGEGGTRPEGLDEEDSILRGKQRVTASRLPRVLARSGPRALIVAQHRNPQRLSELGIPSATLRTAPIKELWGIPNELIEPAWRAPELRVPRSKGAFALNIPERRYELPATDGADSIWTINPKGRPKGLSANLESPKPYESSKFGRSSITNGGGSRSEQSDECVSSDGLEDAILGGSHLDKFANDKLRGVSKNSEWSEKPSRVKPRAGLLPDPKPSCPSATSHCAFLSNPDISKATPSLHNDNRLLSVAGTKKKNRKSRPTPSIIHCSELRKLASLVRRQELLRDDVVLKQRSFLSTDLNQRRSSRHKRQTQFYSDIPWKIAGCRSALPIGSVLAPLDAVRPKIRGIPMQQSPGISVIRSSLSAKSPVINRLVQVLTVEIPSRLSLVLPISSPQSPPRSETVAAISPSNVALITTSHINADSMDSPQRERSLTTPSVVIGEERKGEQETGTGQTVIDQNTGDYAISCRKLPLLFDHELHKSPVAATQLYRHMLDPSYLFSDDDDPTILLKAPVQTPIRLAQTRESSNVASEAPDSCCSTEAFAQGTSTASSLGALGRETEYHHWAPPVQLPTMRRRAATTVKRKHNVGIRVSRQPELQERASTIFPGSVVDIVATDHLTSSRLCSSSAVDGKALPDFPNRLPASAPASTVNHHDLRPGLQAEGGRVSVPAATGRPFLPVSGRKTVMSLLPVFRGDQGAAADDDVDELTLDLLCNKTASPSLRTPTRARGFAAVIAHRAMAAAAAKALSPIKSPGGTPHRCGENGFSCDREFCFTCIS